MTSWHRALNFNYIVNAVSNAGLQYLFLWTPHMKSFAKPEVFITLYIAFQCEPFDYVEDLVENMQVLYANSYQTYLYK